MPSAEHEAPIALIRHDPGILADLLIEVFGVDLPAYTSIRLHSEDIQVTVPATYHADSIVVYADADQRPAFAVVLEVQRSYDKRKSSTWLPYLAHTQAELEVPAALLVYCPDRAVARRYQRRLRSQGMSLTLHPFFLTPDEVPLITAVEDAAQRPTLALLSVLAHCRDPDIEDAFPALASALEAVGPGRWSAYHDIVLTGFAGDTRTHWRDYMTATPSQSEWLSEEYRAAEARGINRGRAEGKAEGKAESLLLILAARGVTPTDTDRDRILAATDADLLDTWLRRAVTSGTLNDVFDD